MVTTRILSEKQRRDEIDQAFKIVMSDGYILAPVLGEVIDELRGKDTESIMRCLDLGKDKRTVIMKSAESASISKGPVIRDTVFDVHLPHSKKVKVIVAVEGESRYDSDSHAFARYIYYAARMLSDQKGIEFVGDNYGDLKKVVVVWVNLNPPKRDRNSLTRYRMNGECSAEFSIGKCARYCDYIEIVEICIGKADEGYTGMMGILNTVFDNSITDDEKKDEMWKKYNIALTDRTLRGINKMANLTEEYMQSLYDQCYEEWHDEGREEGIQQGMVLGKIEGIALAVSALVSERGYSIDDAVAELRIDKEIIPEVKRKAEARLRQVSH